MNAEHLLAHFERISEAPDAIARLRRFILDLAVRGKLVEQDPEDEPAEELLGRILELKIRSTGKLPKSNSQMIDRLFDDEPFAIPDSWTWVVLGQITDLITSGSRDWAKHYSNSGAIFVRMGNLVKCDYRLRLDSIQHVSPPAGGEGTRTRLEAWDVLVSITGDVGMLGLIPEGFGEAYINQHTALARPCFLLKGRYLPEFLRSDFAQNQFQEPQRGIKNSFRLSDLSAIVVPLPPLAEQQRIVAKLDELMALCDQLEAARNQRQQCRERLLAATLQRLNQPAADPATFRKDASFALQVLPSLTTTPAQIKQLRQTILNLAVRGELVEQDPEDEPVQGFIDETRIQLLPKWPTPSSWRWVRLRDIGRLKGGGTPSKARDDFWHGDIPWVSPKDMKVDYLNGAQLSITDAAIKNSAVNLVEPQSILFVVRGMILAHSFPVAISKAPLTINQDMRALVPRQIEMSEYLLRSLKGLKPEILKKVQRSSHGTCRIEGKDYSDFPIPLPPLAEQHRIVAKVDVLMALCDQLEQQLSQADQQRRRLLEALLAEALGGRLPIEQEESHAAIA
jgi:type I restriction enzyme S subunit